MLEGVARRLVAFLEVESVDEVVREAEGLRIGREILDAAAFIGPESPVDASQYTGITFTIKGAKAIPVIVKLQNPDSEPPFCQCGGPADAPRASCRRRGCAASPRP